MIRYTFTLFFLLVVGSAWSQTHLYVSVSGNDTNQGKKAAPFKTIKRAQEAVRKLGTNSKKDIIVHLAPGTYYQETPLVFSAEDAGNKGNNVVYKADDTGKTIISGGKTVTDWEASPEEGIYQAKIQSRGFRQFYTSDKKAVRARYPDKGNFLESGGWDLKDKAMVAKGNYGYLNAIEGLELKLFQSWAEAFLRIEKIETTGISYLKYSNIGFKDNEADILFNRPYPVHKPSHRFYFENAKIFLDQEREWYFDQTNAMLYYKPSAHEDMANLEAIYPVTDTLLIIQGTPKKPVRNLVFEGISFQYSNWTYPSENGYLNGQTGQHNYKATPQNDQYVKRPPAAVYVAHAENVRFESNTFQNLGATGIDFHQGVKNSHINGNIFRDIAGNGVLVGKFTQDEGTEFHVPYNPANVGEICTNVTISNNLIERAASDYSGCVGIGAGYPREIKIVNNVIRELPYSGISLGFGWTDKPNAMSNNLIAYNDISKVMQLMNDGAGIYTLSYQPGTRIFRNHIHNLPEPKLLGQKIICNIYCDERSGGSEENPMVIEENIISGPTTMYRFNQTGIILMKNNIQNLHHKNGKEIMGQVGLEKNYRHLLVKP